MAQNITLQGATYSAVPAVQLPKQGGGTAQFDDTTDATLDSGGKMLSGVTAYAGGTKYTGSIVSRDSSDLQVWDEIVVVPAGYYASEESASVPTTTVATPVATKGAVNNHSIAVTPSITQTYGYVSSITKTGTAVSVSASELVSGNKAITSNGNNIDVTEYATVSVNVSGGGSMNTQVAQSTSRASTTSYTNLVSLTCSKAGTYDVYWTGFRSSTSGTWGSQLYLGGTAYGTAQATFSNHIQNVHLTGVTISANQSVAVYARSRGSNYYAYVSNLVIVQTA